MKVHGLEHFTRAMSEHTSDFVVIGGVASLLLIQDAGLDSRATKDIDIVVLASDVGSFSQHLLEYIKKCGYSASVKGADKKCFYRFQNPTSAECPLVLEIFASREEVISVFETQHVAPLAPISDSSERLSAILLEEDYIKFIRENIVQLSGLPVSNTRATIVLKARAFMDLSTRKNSGDGTVDTKDINKHRGDILKLSEVMTRSESYRLEGLPRQHMKDFIQALRNTDSAQLKAVLKNKDIKSGADEILQVLESSFGLLA